MEKSKTNTSEKTFLGLFLCMRSSQIHNSLFMQQKLILNLKILFFYCVIVGNKNDGNLQLPKCQVLQNKNFSSKLQHGIYIYIYT